MLKNLNMKKIYLITIIGWAAYAILNHGELKPKEDYFLFTLCAVSVLLSVIGIIILWYERKLR